MEVAELRKKAAKLDEKIHKNCIELIGANRRLIELHREKDALEEAENELLNKKDVLKDVIQVRDKANNKVRMREDSDDLPVLFSSKKMAKHAIVHSHMIGLRMEKWDPTDDLGGGWITAVAGIDQFKVNGKERKKTKL